MNYPESNKISDPTPIRHKFNGLIV